MKQMFFFLSFMLFTCCSSDDVVKANVPADAGKTLVVYYSYTGNCREIVSTLTSQIKADVLEIQPAEKGLKYEANNYALGNQLLNTITANPDDASSYPAIDPVTTLLSDYQNIFIVTPLWWSQMAAIMQTYLFNYGSQMTGKHVGLIVSSHTSGIVGVVNDAQRLLPNVTWMGDALWINANNHANRASLIENWVKSLNFAKEKTTMESKMNISIDGETRTITLENNAATRELVIAMKQAPITYEANDYGGFEKVGALGRSLTRNDQQMTAQAGDVVLYNGNNMVLFYGSNSWNYTLLGHIQYESIDELKSFLKAGHGRVSVTLSLSSGISTVSAAHGNTYYSMNERMVESLSHKEI